MYQDKDVDSQEFHINVLLNDIYLEYDFIVVYEIKASY